MKIRANQNMPFFITSLILSLINTTISIRALKESYMINPLRKQVDQDKSFTRKLLNVSGQLVLPSIST